MPENPSKLTKSGKVDRRTIRNPDKLDHDKVLQLKSQGLSDKDIAIHQGVSRTTVWRHLDKYSEEYADLQVFKDNSADTHLYDRFKTRKERIRVLESCERTPDIAIDALGYKEKTTIQKDLKVIEGIIEDKEIDAREGRPQQVNFYQLNLSFNEIESETARLKAELEGN